MVQIIHSGQSLGGMLALGGALVRGASQNRAAEKQEAADRAAATIQQDFQNKILQQRFDIEENDEARKQEEHLRANKLATALQQRFAGGGGAQPAAAGAQAQGGNPIDEPGGLAGTGTGIVEDPYFDGPTEGEDWKNWTQDNEARQMLATIPAGPAREAFKQALELRSAEEHDAAYMKAVGRIGSRLMQQSQTPGVAEKVQRFMQGAANSPMSAKGQYDAIVNLAKSDGAAAADMNRSALAYDRVTAAYGPFLSNGELEEQEEAEMQQLFIAIQAGHVPPSKAMSAARSILIKSGDVDKADIFNPAGAQPAPVATEGGETAQVADAGILAALQEGDREKINAGVTVMAAEERAANTDQSPRRTLAGVYGGQGGEFDGPAKSGPPEAPRGSAASGPEGEQAKDPEGSDTGTFEGRFSDRREVEPASARSPGPGDKESGMEIGPGGMWVAKSPAAEPGKYPKPGAAPTKKTSRAQRRRAADKKRNAAKPESKKLSTAEYTAGIRKKAEDKETSKNTRTDTRNASRKYEAELNSKASKAWKAALKSGKWKDYVPKGYKPTMGFKDEAGAAEAPFKKEWIRKHRADLKAKAKAAIDKKNKKS